jgi:DNA gyrase subunit A
MTNLEKEVVSVNIENEMRSSYLDYAMSVIVGRALPIGRDGLKPVHRRILYAMYREGNLSNKRYSKCAGVVGEVLKKYHPHGDSAVYDTLVRMAQPWNMRYPLIDGQGNFGSIDGDSAAAYRYTECRLTPLAEEMMADIDKDTIDYSANFDDSTFEPVILPTKIPNLLINGSDGIAVGMATKIPPHNLTEILSGIKALINNPDLSFEELLQMIPGPDFPTGGFIYGLGGIKKAYMTGRGVIQMRAKTGIEPIGKQDREAIIVHELPFQVNKARLIESIANLVSQDRLEGISDIRDESDRKGMRVVIELKKSVNAEVILNQLYKHTALQSSFGIILLTIVAGQPRIMNLMDILKLFIKHRVEVVIRRTTYELKEAKRKAHILEGLKIAVENIDEIIALIKKSANPKEAKASLMDRFELSEIQAQAVLDMRLQKLTGLERDKIIEEYESILKLIAELEGILASDDKIHEIILDELEDINTRFGDERRTQIIDGPVESFDMEDLIQEEEVVVTKSHKGYFKRNSLDLYRAQNRGGRGVKGMETRDEDFVENIFITSTHSYFLIFTNLGRVQWLKVYQIPEAGRTAKGKAIQNLIPLKSDEKVAAILPVREFKDDHFVVFSTKQGIVKKTALGAYSKPRQGGIIALGIADDDELVSVKLTNGDQDVFVATEHGQIIRFNEKGVRPTGRSASGVKGISLSDSDQVVGMSVPSSDCKLLTVSTKGYGKRTELEDYRIQNRGGSGLIAMKTNDKTGSVVETLAVTDSDDIMLITNGGKVIRMPITQISVIGRNTQGVRLIQLSPDEKVVSVAKVAKEEDAEEVQAEE